VLRFYIVFRHIYITPCRRNIGMARDPRKAEHITAGKYVITAKYVPQNVRANAFIDSGLVAIKN
jgi:hypothetical protein